jgi:hypothetical protein
MSGFSIKRLGVWIAISTPPIAFYVLPARFRIRMIMTRFLSAY